MVSGKHSHMTIWFFLSIALLNLIGCSSVPKTFSPQQSISPVTFTHQAFQQTLEQHVIDGVVNYQTLTSDQDFHAYLNDLKHLAPQQLPTPNHRLAFWINTYNAFAIQGILDGYSPSTFSGRYTYFIAQDYIVGDEPINLYEVGIHLTPPVPTSCGLVFSRRPASYDTALPQSERLAAVSGRRVTHVLSTYGG